MCVLKLLKQILIHAGRQGVVESLLNHGADVDPKNIEGCTPLIVAAKKGSCQSGNHKINWNYSKKYFHLCRTFRNSQIVVGKRSKYKCPNQKQ